MDSRKDRPSYGDTELKPQRIGIGSADVVPAGGEAVHMNFLIVEWRPSGRSFFPSQASAHLHFNQSGTLTLGGFGTQVSFARYRSLAGSGTTTGRLPIVFLYQRYSSRNSYRPDMFVPELVGPLFRKTVAPVPEIVLETIGGSAGFEAPCRCVHRRQHFRHDALAVGADMIEQTG